MAVALGTLNCDVHPEIHCYWVQRFNDCMCTWGPRGLNIPAEEFVPAQTNHQRVYTVSHNMT